MNLDIFEDLFVLELANNHWGKLERGLKIISEFAKVVRFNNVRAAIKFQFRDVDTFIHKDFRTRTDIRYIKKPLDTHLPKEALVTLVAAVRRSGVMSMATPFDQKSVELCVELGLPLIKLASSDVNDWPLIERVARTHKPVICSTGGTSQKDLDDLVTFFDHRNIPLAINHCVSLYPSEDSALELNQIDFLKRRYPNHTIGFSTHEHTSWEASMHIAYAKGARTFERHIDIDDGTVPVAPYSSLPAHFDTCFKEFHKAKEMCGASGESKRQPRESEIQYLDGLVCGVYARRDLPASHSFEYESIEDDVYMAITLQKGQISCRELMSGEVLTRALAADAPVMIDDIESAYAYNEELKQHIYRRGI